MSRFLLTYQIDAASEQTATALRDRCAAYLRAEGTTVIHSAVAATTREFEVVGVDTAGKAPFKERTKALDEAEAKALVVGTSKTKIVAEVRRV